MKCYSQSRSRFTMFLALLLLGSPLVAVSQMTGPQPAPAPQPAQAQSPTRGEAIEFLQKVERKNEEIKSLSAEFEQLRVDPIFHDEVESKGKFWYRSPGEFRASYDSRHPAEIWIFPDHLINYSPSIKQVDILPIEQGENAPINQMLLGFGVKTESILEVFDVGLIEAEKDGQVAIEFHSRDLDRSLYYRRIVIHFQEENAEPAKLFLEDGESEITVTIRGVKQNPDLDAALFTPKWPDDVEVIDQR
ncbi:MAG: outer membrane lipoprotein carrier protein LolA [Candidatus Sumerlaeia bacterium]|nr:outer membrane lipoprotein carrier protein LolA [Candidatus Sumerlaeia bacterium]